MKPVRMLMLIASAVLLIAVLAVLFVAYQQPGLLIDFTNLVYC